MEMCLTVNGKLLVATAADDNFLTLINCQSTDCLPYLQNPIILYPDLDIL